MKTKLALYIYPFVEINMKIIVLLLSIIALPARALTMEWVTVGHPGNTPDTLVGSADPLGAVSDAFLISRYEVTNRQYAEFLNAVDPEAQNLLGLHHFGMEAPQAGGGITINFSNASGEKYVLIAGFEEKPVVFASWYSTIRFVNWMNNGQGASDTETGAYEIEGETPIPSNFDTIHRTANAVFFLPNKDEWYKAGYFNGSRYFDYPASSDELITCSHPTDAPNSANCGRIIGLNALTVIGSYPGSTSPYGTYDQAGNAYEWVENAFHGGTYHVAMGGSFSSTQSVQYTGAYRALFGDQSSQLGFRIGRAIGDHQCISSLEQALLDLAVATADIDNDGIRDTADACPSTPEDVEVDALGCSQAQFCGAIDASGSGRAACNNSDWGNDEPLAENPEDCKAAKGICQAK